MEMEQIIIRGNPLTPQSQQNSNTVETQWRHYSGNTMTMATQWK